MKNTCTLSQFDTVIQRFRALAKCGVLHHEESKPLNVMAREASKAFMSFPVPEKDADGNPLPSRSTVEDFIEATKNNQFHIEKLMKEAFGTAKGDPRLQNYRMKELMVSDENLVDFAIKEHKLYREKIDFLFRPVFIDVARIEKLYKFLNRSVEGYVFDLAHVFPEETTVTHREGEYKRSPYQDFLDLEFEGFVYSDKDEYDEAIANDLFPVDGETKAIQSEKVLNSIVNK